MCTSVGGPRTVSRLLRVRFPWASSRTGRAILTASGSRRAALVVHPVAGWVMVQGVPYPGSAVAVAGDRDAGCAAERNPAMGESQALVATPVPDFAPGDASVFAAYPGPYPTPDVVVDLREHRIDVARLLKASTFGSGNFVLPNRRPCRCLTRGLQREVVSSAKDLSSSPSTPRERRRLLLGLQPRGRRRIFHSRWGTHWPDRVVVVTAIVEFKTNSRRNDVAYCGSAATISLSSPGPLRRPSGIGTGPLSGQLSCDGGLSRRRESGRVHVSGDGWRRMFRSGSRRWWRRRVRV